MSTPVMLTLMFAIAAVTVLGDYYLKLGSEQQSWLFNRWVAYGVGIYALSALGWVYAMRHMKLSTIAVLYSVSNVVLLVLLGVIVFGERLKPEEMAGLFFAILSIVLMSRFSA